MTSILMSFSGIAHKHGCYALPKGVMKTVSGSYLAKYTVLAPEIAEDEAPAFIRARRLKPCGSCWPGLRQQIEDEMAVRS